MLCACRVQRFRAYTGLWVRAVRYTFCCHNCIPYFYRLCMQRKEEEKKTKKNTTLVEYKWIQIYSECFFERLENKIKQYLPFCVISVSTSSCYANSRARHLLSFPKSSIKISIRLKRKRGVCSIQSFIEGTHVRKYVFLSSDAATSSQIF